MTGRPRKQGKREKSGRIQRDSVHVICETVAIQRCRAMGWKPTIENQKKARSATYGTQHGKLFGRGLIDADQWTAAELFQKRDSAYRSITGLPRPTVSAANIEGDKGGTPPEMDPVELRKQVDRAASELADVNRALLDARAVASTTTLVIHQQEIDEFSIPSVQRGLQAVFNACVSGQRRKAG